MYRFKPLINCCERNIEIAKHRGYLDIEQTTKTPYVCDREYLYINEGDYNGLTLNEIKQLEEYIPPIIEEL